MGENKKLELLLDKARQWQGAVKNAEATLVKIKEDQDQWETELIITTKTLEMLNLLITEEEENI